MDIFPSSLFFIGFSLKYSTELGIRMFSIDIFDESSLSFSYISMFPWLDYRHAGNPMITFNLIY